jgi:hypothetical protein
MLGEYPSDPLLFLNFRPGSFIREFVVCVCVLVTAEWAMLDGLREKAVETTNYFIKMKIQPLKPVNII